MRESESENLMLRLRSRGAHLCESNMDVRGDVFEDYFLEDCAKTGLVLREGRISG